MAGKHADWAHLDWYAGGVEHLWLPYTQMKTAPAPTPVVATEGAYLELADGRKLLDGVSSWWTACHGYNHPHIGEAVRTQLERMPHVMLGGLVHEPACRLAQRLAQKLPGDLSKVFFSDSGSVSVEVALKMAMQYWINRGLVDERASHKHFICFERGYHGDTLGTMAISDLDSGMHHVFKKALARHIKLPLPTTPEMEAVFREFIARHHHDLAGVILEPSVQGAGGMKFHEPSVLRFLRETCDDLDMLLIFDEIMTGFGRTGPMFACGGAGVVPDILTLSKALTGGTVPFAATIATLRVADTFYADDPDAALMHGPTYMANPLGATAANASLDLFETEPRLEQVVRIEKELAQGLAPARDLPGVADVRVRGALGIIEMAEPPDTGWLKQRFIEEGVFIRPFDNMIYVAPPFILTSEEVGRLTEAMVKVTTEYTLRQAAE